MLQSIETRFQVPLLDDEVRQKAVDYWSRRGVHFAESSASGLSGRRGNLWGNLTSFDMSRLVTQITISFRASGEISCLLEVNTDFQVITEWSLLWWQLELDSFRSFLLREDEQPERWQEFQRRYNRHSAVWSATLGTQANRLAPDDRTWLASALAALEHANLPIPCEPTEAGGESLLPLPSCAENRETSDEGPHPA